MAANDLWNGFITLGTGVTLTSGVVAVVDASAAAAGKYQRKIRVPGGASVQFSCMARAISGTGHLYCDLASSGNLIADLDVTGHDDWRIYTLRFSVPINQGDALLLIGVGTYTAELGSVEYRAPFIAVDGVPVISGTAYSGWRESGSGGSQSRIAAATADADRMTIDESGRVMIGSTDVDPIAAAVAGLSLGDTTAGRLKAYQASTNAALWSRGSDGEVETYYRVTGAGANTKVGSISITTTATAYNTSSDYRLKRDIEPLSGAVEQIKALRPVLYNWNIDADGTPKTQGFIAHEIAAVLPQAVTGKKDALDGDGLPEYQGVDAGKAVPVLVAALQEALLRIEALEAKGG